MSKEFKPIMTQEEFDRAIQDRLAREREKFADYEDIKRENAKLKTEINTLKTTLEESNKKIESYDKDISELNKKIAGYETANLKTKIGLQHGLPYDLIDRLVGEDEEIITEDAKKLAELVKKNEPIAPLKDVEPPISSGEDGAYKSLLQKLKGE